MTVRHDPEGRFRQLPSVTPLIPVTGRRREPLGRRTTSAVCVLKRVVSVDSMNFDFLKTALLSREHSSFEYPPGDAHETPRS